MALIYNHYNIAIIGPAVIGSLVLVCLFVLSVGLIICVLKNKKKNQGKIQ